MFSSTIFAIFSLILTYEYNYDKNDFINKRAHFFNNDEQTIFGLMILMWIFTSITLILAILNTNLVFFHFWLIKNKMTTYEYILMRREKSGKKVDVIILANLLYFKMDKKEKEIFYQSSKKQ